jgi:hypothetical protein
MDPSQSFIQWAIGQGVAVAVLAFVLVRLDGRLSDLTDRVNVLIAILTKSADRSGG